jgi:hypothetical protein
MVRACLHGLVFLLCQCCVLYLLSVWSLATARNTHLQRLLEQGIRLPVAVRSVLDGMIAAVVPWTVAMTQPAMHLLMRDWDSERALRFLSWSACFRLVLLGWIAWIAPELLLPTLTLLALGAPFFAARVQSAEGAVDMDSVFIRRQTEAPMSGAVAEGLTVTVRTLSKRLPGDAAAALLGGLLYASAPNDIPIWAVDGVGALGLPLALLGGGLSLLAPGDLLRWAPLTFGLWAWQVPGCFLVPFGVGLELTSPRTAALAGTFLKPENRLLWVRHSRVAVLVMAWFLGLYVAAEALIFTP